MRCLHCHGGEAIGEDSHSLARDRCYYCQHSKYGNGRMECEKCQVRLSGLSTLIGPGPWVASMHKDPVKGKK